MPKMSANLSKSDWLLWESGISHFVLFWVKAVDVTLLVVYHLDIRYRCSHQTRVCIINTCNAGSQSSAVVQLISFILLVCYARLIVG
jgi:hypothetical protein